MICCLTNPHDVCFEFFFHFGNSLISSKEAVMPTMRAHVHACTCMCVCDMYMYGILTVMGNCWKSLIVMSHFGHATSLKCSLFPSFPSTFPVGNTWLILRCFDILMIHMHAHGIRTEGTVSYPLVPVSFYGFVYFFPL